MSLLAEFTGIPTYQKPDLKKSDSSDAGRTDVSGKTRPDDIGFSLMRNTINSDGEITGSDVADYLERAGELNDEVDTVPFGLETDDGDIVKVYVNVEQADKFEEAMKKLLGLEDDIEEAINKLALEFDIVDVVWPVDKNEDEDEAIDLDAAGEFDGLDSSADDEPMDVVAEYDPLEENLSEVKEGSVNRDPKEPSQDEAAAYGKLMDIIMNLAAMGSAGVTAATGYDPKELTKLEMIKKFVNSKYPKECALSKVWMKRVGDEIENDDILPFWLQEHLSESAELTNKSTNEGDDMSIGSQFLARLTEAKGEKKGFEFDRGTEAMKRAMRKIGGDNDFADKIAEVMAMCGISGMYSNKPEVRESVLDAAQVLRTKPARVRSFLALHSVLSKFHGVTPPVVAEGKEDDLEGNAFQQLVEEVLVSLGVPEEMMGGDAKAGVKAGIRRTVAALKSDDLVRAAFVAYARYAGIRVGDKVVGVKKPGQKVEEAKMPAIDPNRYYVIAKKEDSGKTIVVMRKNGYEDSEAAEAACDEYKETVAGDDIEIFSWDYVKGSKLAKILGEGLVVDDDENDETDPVNLKDLNASATAIAAAMGMNMADEKMVRVVNPNALARSIRTACRDSKVKRGMAAFLRAIK